MTFARILFELSGEHPTLPAAELLATLSAESPGSQVHIQGPGYLVAELDLGTLPGIVRRLGLTHRFGRFLGSCEPDSVVAMAAGLGLPEGSICVRARKVEGRCPDVSTHDLSVKIGRSLSPSHRIDLRRPELSLRVLLSDRALFFLVEGEVERRELDMRKVAERPFFSPISLHPRFARALINLTRARRGDLVLDPFCGTGGIVLEAALMGMRALGSDIDREMVEGCRRNLEHFGVEAELFEADVGEVPELLGRVDAVATDPPYGRAASTNKEDIDALYLRAMRAMAEVLPPGGMAGMVLPREVRAEGFDVLETHRQRVHRSLTRHYHVLIRR